MKTWIKLRSNLETVEEFLLMRTLLNADSAALVGYLYRWWNYCDQNSRRGELRNLTLEVIDAFTTAGFGEALLKAGWLREDDGTLKIPNFQRHFSHSSKARDNDASTETARGLHNGGSKAQRGPNGRFLKRAAADEIAAPGTKQRAAAEATTAPGTQRGTNTRSNTGSNTGDQYEDVLDPIQKSQLVDNTNTSRAREEKNREEKIGGDSDLTAGGGGGPLPQISFLEFSEAARLAGCPEERWQSIYADLASRRFQDRAGKRIKDLPAYLRRCWSSDPAVQIDPKAFCRQPWQVEADLRRMEARLKAEADGFKPNQELMKALRAERSRLKTELTKVLLQAAKLENV